MRSKQLQCAAANARRGIAAAAAVLLFGFLVAPTAVVGQQTGSIRGQVTMAEDGSPLGFAQIVIVELGRGTLANENGEYLFTAVPAGSYTLQATIIGFRTGSAQVQVSAGETAVHDFALGTNLLDLEALVVTATANPRSKLESSTAITTMTAADIELAAPRNTADLLSAVPGFYVESSGGNVGNNLFVRGLPAPGSYRYVAIMENGMPVYDATSMSFVNADIFVRADENIKRVEAMRGGNSALYGSNAPGGVINFISKTGGPERAGTIEATVGTSGLYRIDGNVNGPVGNDWRYSVGGFYRYDQGVRDPGFAAANGGQLKANVTRLFSNGYFRVYGKFLNDRNMFLLPLPFQSGEDLEFVPGFDESGTMTTVHATELAVPLPGGGSQELPLKDGQKQVGGSVMAELGLSFGAGWSLTNKLRYMNIDHEWNALLPFTISEAGVWADSVAESIFGPGATGQLEYADGGTFTTPNGLVATGGLWHIDKPMSNISNQLQLQKDFDSHQITVGTYFGHYLVDETWYFNNVLMEVAAQPRLLDLTVNSGVGGLSGQATQNGFINYVNTYVNGSGNVTLFAGYVGDVIQLTDRVRLDLGARVEHDAYHYEVEETAPNDLSNDANGFGPAEAVQYGTGAFSSADPSFTDWAASVGLNYALSDNSAVYARGSRGYKMPILGTGIVSADTLVAEQLLQAEAGYKLSTPKVGLSAVGYWLQLSNFQTSDARVDPVTGATNFVIAYVGEARTIGAELETVVAPVEDVRLTATLTLQNHEYTNFATGLGSDRVVYTGNQIRRIPQVMADLGASYDLGPLTVGGQWRYIGKRWSNDSNTIELPAYSVFNAQFSYDLPQRGLTLRVDALNIADGRGLTEGNPRLDESLTGVGSFYFARPILPRRFIASLEYSF